MLGKNLVEFRYDGVKNFRFVKTPKINLDKYRNLLDQMENHEYGSNEYLKCRYRLKMMIKDGNGVKGK